jgi:hypothetical protein
MRLKLVLQQNLINNNQVFTFISRNFFEWYSRDVKFQNTEFAMLTLNSNN